jgi:transglutaminase-like putative cysteine protease
MAAVGTLTRLRALRGLPAAACLCIALVVLLLYLNVVYAAEFSFLRVVPTGASVTHLWNLARQGMADTQRFAPPVPPLNGTVLLATAGIGAIAALTDLVAVRLRRCALAGLPLLALFSVPVAAGVEKNAVGTAVVFCLGMVGYLALLGADGQERLRLWGRLVTPWQPAADEPGDDQSGPNTRALAASGRRIGLAAVVLAIFAPLLIPGLHAHKIFPGRSVGNGPGVGTGTGGHFPDPLVQMNKDLQESKPQVVLTYRTSDPAYPPNLQTYVLNNLTTDSWTMSLPGNGTPLTQSGGLPRVPGLVQAHWRKILTSVAIRQGTRGLPSDASFLPAPYPSRVLTSAGNWKADPGTLMLYSTSQSLSGLNYRVISYDVTPTEQLLAAAGPPPPAVASYLQVPGPFVSLRGYARQITKGATSRFAEAVALQDWFRSKGGFSYSLKVAAPKGAADLRQFLLSSKRGYCQQFAFAMAVLARLLGIPSRIVVGFTAGSRLGHGKWQVKTSDAHSWPELYFTGFGWLSWEPTPGGTGVGQGTAVAPAYTQPGSGGGTSTGPRGVTGPVSRQNQPGQTGGTLGIGKKRALQEAGQTGLPGTTAPRGGGLPAALLVIAALLVMAPGGSPRNSGWTRPPARPCSASLRPRSAPATHANRYRGQRYPTT